MVGDISTSDIDYITSQSKKWSIQQKPQFELSFQNKIGRVHVEKKDALQTALRVGKILFNKEHEDYIAFTILNTILGDYFGILVNNVRLKNKQHFHLCLIVLVNFLIFQCFLYSLSSINI